MNAQQLTEELLQQGTIHFRAGLYAQALQCYEDILALHPRHVQALHNRASVMMQLGRNDEALAGFAHVLSIDPDRLDTLNNYAFLLQVLGRPQESLSCLNHLLQLKPDYVLALLNQWSALKSLGRWAEAQASLDRVLALDPHHIHALTNSAFTLNELAQPQAALQQLDTALARHPDHVAAMVIKGMILAQQARHDEALLPLQRALMLDPGHAEARVFRGMAQLSLGRLRDGFVDLEGRWRTPALRRWQSRSTAPLWQGQPLNVGTTILLEHEQGYGDTIQFIRYATLLEAKGVRVLLVVPEPLRRLMQTCKGVATVVAEDEPLPAHDLRCPIMGLPHRFGTDLASIPVGVPYLLANEATASAWRSRLGPHSRRRIGLVWAGRQASPSIPHRDIPLKQLMPLFNLDCEFYSLQKDCPASDLEVLRAAPSLVHAGDRLIDFADTAGLIANLDLIISVDSAVAHLAGAMAKPVWVLNRFGGCWRWLAGRNDSPWYPTVRLFRQRSFLDWGPVVSEVLAELDEGPHVAGDGSAARCGRISTQPGR